MSMFCYQCQETANGEGCTSTGMCGKNANTAVLQDALMHVARGVAIYSSSLRKHISSVKAFPSGCDSWLRVALFTTITNANFDDTAIEAQIFRGLGWRLSLQQLCIENGLNLPRKFDAITNWSPSNRSEILAAGKEVGVLRTIDPDTRSLRELLTYGLKGFAAYLHHAAELGSEDSDLNAFLPQALVATVDPQMDNDTLTGLVLEAGEKGVAAMALLDSANTGRYGHPELTEVRIDVGERPGILVSGHDLSDLEALLEQSKDAGIDVYTHSEMLPAHSYPGLKKYPHLFGNYGNAWWEQHKEFTRFRGPILFTTNCIVPPSTHSNYADKVFTTGAAGFPGCRHIESDSDGYKDFSVVIELAKTCQSPEAIEGGTITIGFAHNQATGLTHSILDAIKEGTVKGFVVMAGCDGRQTQRSYYTDFAKKLNQETIILTAGCAKYRYNKLDLGTINVSNGMAIPRVLDAGQCNDSYSLALTALHLKEALKLDDINELPIEYNIAWYEQKAVIVLLGLLHLGVKNIRLGPTLPAFLSPGVAQLLVDQFGIKGIPSTVAWGK